MGISTKVKKGDSSDAVRVTINGVSDYTDYYGLLHVLDPDNDNTLITGYAVTPTNNAFEIVFSPAQTDSLEIGNYLVVFEMYHKTGEVIDFRREISWPLEVSKSYINVVL